MFKIKLLFAFSLVITGAVCEEVCDEDTEYGFSLIFCDEATQCENETSKEVLDKFRNCVSNKSDNARKVIESGNKLKPEECITDISKGVCPIIKDFKENPLNYAECFIPFVRNDLKSILQSCIEPGNVTLMDLENMTMVICADTSTLKCNNTDALEAVKIVKNCFTDNFPDFKNNGDIDKCKHEAKEKLMSAAKNPDLMEKPLIDFMKCMDAKKDFLDKHETEECPGLQ